MLLKNRCIFLIILAGLILCGCSEIRNFYSHDETQLRDVNIYCDNMQYISKVSASAIVSEALRTVGIQVGEKDIVTPALPMPIPADGNIRVTRVTTEDVTTEQVIPFQSQTVRNESLPDGETRIIQQGQNGTRQTITRYTYEDGIQTAKSIVSVLTIKEAAEYSNIGINKLECLLRSPRCPFVLYVGKKKLVKRKEFEKFISDKVKTLGTAACPPYHLAIVIGGTSAEMNTHTVKLASCGYLDDLPTTGSEGGRMFRDLEMEEKVLHICQKTGIGAQFGGKYFVHDVRVIRCPRHAASCPVSIGVSCSADRNIKAKIDENGLWLEKMEHHPEQYLPKGDAVNMAPAVEIDLDRPMKDVLAELTKYPVKTRLNLKGTMIVARDMAHAKIAEIFDKQEKGEALSDIEKTVLEVVSNHPIYYAGPAKTPEGMPTGSFGPTTAGRMDPYVMRFQSKGASMIMVAKGNRSQDVTDACHKYGGFYLGSIGGPAAILAEQNILSNDIVAFPELGMEAIRKITIKDFPAFILVDDKGNDFFKDLL